MAPALPGATTAADVRHAEALLKTGALQSAIFNSANFSMKLPRVDGLEVLRQIKGDPDLKTIPVVMMTVGAFWAVVNEVPPASLRPIKTVG